MRIIGALSAAILALTSSPALADEQPVVDTDGDGLIEIHTLEDLNSIRYDLAGNSLKRSVEDPGNARGCPRGSCRGYELMADLDFDGPDDDTTTWTRNPDGSHTLDKDDHNNAWFDVEAGGWLPIGDCGPDGLCADFDEDSRDDADDNRPFTAIFEGNGHTIANLAISRRSPALGLFGSIGMGGEIRNIGLVANLSSQDGSAGIAVVGGLVGLQAGGTVTASYTTGESVGRKALGYMVGGLVGAQDGGSVTACYSTGKVDAGEAKVSFAGGLAGAQRGAITASYATGSVEGGKGGASKVGGLVGAQENSSVTASYATGRVEGGNGDTTSMVGGLVGYQENSSITASFATGETLGGKGFFVNIGGLVGYQENSSITASFATGNAIGDADLEEKLSTSIGGLVGSHSDSSIAASYATGDVTGGEGRYFIGGLAGLTSDSSLDDCCHSLDEDVEIGDIIGKLSGARFAIADSYATGNVTGGGGGMNISGGLVGSLGGIVTSSYASGNVSGGDGRDVIGGFSGQTFSAVVIASSATGDVSSGGGQDYAGGFAGTLNGFIVASYATGDVDGGDGTRDAAGGLAGYHFGGAIIASYATGDASGGDGSEDWVGGLVGLKLGGFTTASYATGSALGGDGDEDGVGGLVGRYVRGGVTASFATGAADGGDGDSDSAGALIGIQWRNPYDDDDSSEDDAGREAEDAVAPENEGACLEPDSRIVASWGFGPVFGGESCGHDGSADKPEGVLSAADIAFGSDDEAAGAPPVWNSAASFTQGVWDFGTPEQAPALAYADYDGENSLILCGSAAEEMPETILLIPLCTIPATLIPGQREEE